MQHWQICNLNYSTWHSKYILNIHYFVISPDFREKGVGMFLLNEIEEYAKQEEFCHSNLEVWNEKVKAQKLHKKAG